MPKVGIPGDEQQAEANQRAQDSVQLDNEQKRLQRQEEDLVKEVLIYHISIDFSEIEA